MSRTQGSSTDIERVERQRKTARAAYRRRLPVKAAGSGVRPGAPRKDLSEVKVTFSCALTTAEGAALRAYALSLGKTMSTIMRQAIVAEIDFDGRVTS